MGTHSEPSLLDDLNEAFDAADGVEEIEAVEPVEETEALDNPEIEAEAPEVTEEPELPPLNAPNTWKKEYAERFNELPREVAEYIAQREEEAARGFTQKGQEIAQLRQQFEGFQQTLQPVAEGWVKQGINPETGLKSLVSWFQAIQNDPQTTLLELAKINGVDLKAALDDQPYVDPHIAQMQQQHEQQLNELKQQLNGFTTQQQQAKQHAALEQIKAFESATDETGNPLHPHFETVYEDMALLMQNGKANDLDSAYDMAVHMNPNIRQQLAQKNVQQQAQVKHQQAQKAKAAAQASVSSKETPDIDESDLSLTELLAREYDAAMA